MALAEANGSHACAISIRAAIATSLIALDSYLFVDLFSYGLTFEASTDPELSYLTLISSLSLILTYASIVYLLSFQKLVCFLPT